MIRAEHWRQSDAFHREMVRIEHWRQSYALRRVSIAVDRFILARTLEAKKRAFVWASVWAVRAGVRSKSRSPARDDRDQFNWWDKLSEAGRVHWLHAAAATATSTAPVAVAWAHYKSARASAHREGFARVAPSRHFASEVHQVTGCEAAALAPAQAHGFSPPSDAPA